MNMAAQERGSITKRVNLLLQLITDIQSRDIEELPGPAVSALDDVLEGIKACEQLGYVRRHNSRTKLHNSSR